ncbi:YdcF family protein [Ramlibacter sp.]|uniref:YdcF family protein n=1 Tax=Ramlibacter sp. TaxID=1917967 RepID=UPI002C3A0A48|nr:YdcF family protein [Ramlibacter sp.]HWI81427.1 YdcF family protein [Ramlibacter sp.]
MIGKLVIAAISPLGTALLLGLFGLAVHRWAAAPWRARGLRCVLAALAWLWLWSMPVASHALRGWLEAQAGPRTIDALPAAPAMVVLGGAMRGARPPLRPDPDLGSAADRVWHAARLYRAGKAPLVVLSGGSARPGQAPEAQVMGQLLSELGVPATALATEPRSITTTENAAYTAQLLRQRHIGRILLVTSALHMSRARALFERQGLEVIPAPTDYEVVQRPFDLLQVVPDGEALEGSGRAIKEIVGALVVGQPAITSR